MRNGTVRPIRRGPGTVLSLIGLLFSVVFLASLLLLSSGRDQRFAERDTPTSPPSNTTKAPTTQPR